MSAKKPYPNRVDPFGAIHAVQQRGLFTGNRGVIHDPATRRLLGRRWSTKAWIICDCGFEGRKRDVMGANAPTGGAGWTNLFFLDEVTALAAGHRPCFYCRRDRAKIFAKSMASGLSIASMRAGEIDARLHAERLMSKTPSPLSAAASIDSAAFGALPDGTMVFEHDRAFAKWRGGLRRWDFGGWLAPSTSRDPLPPGLRLLTPPSTVAALSAGYSPAWHASIDRPA